MIAANVEAARFLLKKKLPALFRNHASPSDEKSDALRAYLGTLGLTLPKVKKPTSADYQKVAELIADRDDARVIGMMILRAMMQAEYAPTNEGHFGLALSEYAHFTSPIRRYPDLLVHRAIGHALDERKKRYRYTHKDMVALGRHASMTERRAEEATRDVDKWLKCEYMLDHVGDEFDGTVVAITEFGLFVEIDALNVEGLVHVTSLGHDYFKMDPRGHLLVGRRTGLQYKLMQKLKVRVAGVNIEDRKIDFELVEQGRKRRGKRRA